VQGGPKSDVNLLVLEFPLTLAATYLQFLFSGVLFSLNDVVLRLGTSLVLCEQIVIS